MHAHTLSLPACSLPCALSLHRFPLLNTSSCRLARRGQVRRSDTHTHRGDVLKHTHTDRQAAVTRNAQGSAGYSSGGSALRAHGARRHDRIPPHHGCIVFLQVLSPSDARGNAFAGGQRGRERDARLPAPRQPWAAALQGDRPQDHPGRCWTGTISHKYPTYAFTVNILGR